MLRTSARKLWEVLVLLAHAGVCIRVGAQVCTGLSHGMLWCVQVQETLSEELTAQLGALTHFSPPG